ncbi:MAG: hypothetical protein HN350_14835 [Phycisphaerales bacterium]|jgi:hypothetical protein|nr:hypothetical protein [Phycisphaerales bacterium]
MTTVWITAGLGVQDTSTPEPEDLSAFITAGVGASELPHTGYRLYIGLGGLEGVDFDAEPDAVIPAGQSVNKFLGCDFEASSRYVLVLRPVINGLETPDISCRFEFEIDANGQWLGVRPGAVEAFDTETLSSGQVRLFWTYRTPDGAATPEDFCVYHASNPQISPGSPQAVVSYEQDGVYSCTLSLIGGQTYFFAVTARDACGVESHLSQIIGPVLADASIPLQPQVVLTTIY